MKSRKFFIYLTLLILFIFLLNSLALRFYWYSSIWYFDMWMHFLGGIWLGFLGVYALDLFQKSSKKVVSSNIFERNLLSKKEPTIGFILKIVLFVFLVGAGWEVFEILLDTTITHNSFNVLDSVSDIFFDLAGGIFALFYFFRRLMPRFLV